MHKFIYSVKDSWISELTSSRNFGHDEILEIRKDFNSNTTSSVTYGVSRTFVQFDLNETSKSVATGDIPSSAKYYLRLYSTEPSHLPTEYELRAYPVSSSWEEGTGKLNSDPIIQNGITWTHPNYEAGTATTWSLEGGYGDSGSRYYENGTTLGGGVWITGSGYESSQSFSYESPDVRMDVTDIIAMWYSGSTYSPIPINHVGAVPGKGGYENYGFIVKYNNTMESTESTDRGNLKFFSRNTNTIYPPKLEIVWDDHIGPPNYTSSFTALDMTGEVDNHVYVKGLKESYKETEEVKFRVGARKRYIDKTVSTTYQTATGSYIADTSGSYSIVDVATGDVLVPFGDYSLLSLDSGSMYFNQDLNSFQSNRIYKILIKVNYDDGQEVIYDDGYEFKVVR